MERKGRKQKEEKIEMGSITYLMRGSRVKSRLFFNIRRIWLVPHDTRIK